MMDFSYIIHFGMISLALVLGSILRSKIKVFQRFLLPASIIGGFLLLLYYNYVAPLFGMNSDFLGEIVYHLLNVSFISMMLRPDDEIKEKLTPRRLGQNVVATIAQYGLQVTFGLLATALLIATVMPDLFPAIGLILPLGFELGPGQAYSMTLPWESMGFEGATSVGLTIAAMGFLIGSIGGVILINLGIRNGWVSKEAAEKIRSKGIQTGFVPKSDRKVGAMNTTDGESIDSFTYHVCLIFVTYLISWGFLWVLTYLLCLIGPTGASLAESLWGINFVFSSLIASAVKVFMKKIKVDHTVDTKTLNRINGFAVDLTVVSSLGAISLVAIASYWLPIIVLTLIGIFITTYILPYYCSRLFDDNQFYRMLVLFGTATGTLPTGLSLLRVVDPDFETPAARDFTYASGVVFFLVIPIILCVNLPAISYVNNQPIYFWAMVGIGVFYTLVCLIFYIKLSKGRAFSKNDRLFFREYKEKKRLFSKRKTNV